MKNLKNIILFPILISLIILNFINCSQEPKEKANLLTAVARLRPIQEMIADYLYDEWNLHKHFKEKENVYNIIFLNNDTISFTSFNDTNIYILNINYLNKIALIGHTQRISALTFLPNHKYLISAENMESGWEEDSNRKIKIWDITTGNCIKTLDGHNANILSLAYSNDEKYIASGSAGLKGPYACEVKIWDITTGTCKNTFTLDREIDVNTLMFSPQGNHIFTGTHSGCMRIFDLTSGENKLIDNSRSNKINSFNLSPDCKLLPLASGNDKVKIFNIENLDKVHEARTFTSKLIDNISDIQFSPNGKYIVIAGSGNEKTDYCGQIQIFDSKTFDSIKDFTAHTKMVYQILFSPNGKYLASIGYDGFIKLWTNRPYELLEETEVDSNEKKEKEILDNNNANKQNDCCVIS